MLSFARDAWREAPLQERRTIGSRALPLVRVGLVRSTCRSGYAHRSCPSWARGYYRSGQLGPERGDGPLGMRGMMGGPGDPRSYTVLSLTDKREARAWLLLVEDALPEHHDGDEEDRQKHETDEPVPGIGGIRGGGAGHKVDSHAQPERNADHSHCLADEPLEHHRPLTPLLCRVIST